MIPTRVIGTRRPSGGSGTRAGEGVMLWYPRFPPVAVAAFSLRGAYYCNNQNQISCQVLGDLLRRAETGVCCIALFSAETFLTGRAP